MKLFHHKAIAAGLALSLTLGGASALAVAPALAQEASGDAASSEPNATNGYGTGVAYDKAEWYNADGNPADSATDDEAAMALMSDEDEGIDAQALEPMNLSDDMKWFAKWESSQNYDQGLSSGDAYNAVGYYQFDRRYGLMDFITQVYNYNPNKYACFKELVSRSGEVSGFIYANGIAYNPLRRWELNQETNTYYANGLSDLGNLLNSSWHAAYKADPTEFAGLQDAWAYQQYYAPIANWFADRGIDLSKRSDSVKSLVWGMSNLFGQGGVLYATKGGNTVSTYIDVNGNTVTGGKLYTSSYGDKLPDGSGGYITRTYTYKQPNAQGVWTTYKGTSYSYDPTSLWIDSGVGYNGAKTFFVGAGVNNSMSDEEFVTAVCDYLLNNITKFYYWQGKYWQGWTNRYKDEKAHYLDAIAKKDNSNDADDRVDDDTTVTTRFTDVDSGAWYAKAVKNVSDMKLMNGYSGGNVFGVGDSIIRADLACVLFNYAKSHGVDESLYPKEYNTTELQDLQGGMYYTSAANWAVRNEIINGSSHPDGSKTFDADEPVTFEMLVTILANYCASPSELDSASKGDLSSFADGSEVSSWAKASMVWATKKGLVNGSQENGAKYLRPSEDVARERVAAVISNALEKGEFD